MFCHITIVGPVFFCYTSDSTTLQLVRRYIPEMELFQSKNMYFQIFPNQWVEYFCLNIIICYSLYYALGILIYSVFALKITKYTKVSSSKQLVRMQLMFFKIITFQGIVEVVLVISPAYVMALSFYFKLKYISQITMIATTVCSLQAWLNYICIMYNVTPYRKTVKSWFNILSFSKKYGCINVNSSLVVSIGPTSNTFLQRMKNKGIATN